VKRVSFFVFGQRFGVVVGVGGPGLRRRRRCRSRRRPRRRLSRRRHGDQSAAAVFDLFLLAWIDLLEPTVAPKCEFFVVFAAGVAAAGAVILDERRTAHFLILIRPFLNQKLLFVYKKTIANRVLSLFVHLPFCQPLKMT
jgi:hypothetical protein